MSAVGGVRSSMLAAALRLVFGMALVVILAAPRSASAQQGIGNGGVGLSCPDLTGSSVVVADAVYGALVWGMIPDLGPASLSWYDKVELAIKRLPLQDVLRRRKYLNALRTYRRWSEYVPTSGLAMTFDYLFDPELMRELLVTHGCRVVQLANLRFRSSSDKYRCFINMEEFEALSSDQRALLFLHEIVYREWLDLGRDKTLASVYLLVAMLASNHEALADFDRYSSLIRGSGWPIYHPRAQLRRPDSSARFGTAGHGSAIALPSVGR